MFDKLQAFLEKTVGPIAAKLNQSKIIQALGYGMMMAMPITLGAAFIAILGNVPFPQWTGFLTQIGMDTVIADVLSVTITLLPVYIIFTISHNYAKQLQSNPVTVAIISMAFLLILVPLRIGSGEDQILALSTNYLGSNGIFIAMLTAIIVPRMYSFLEKKNIKIKLPDTVPPMVSDSLSPTFIAMILFIIAFFIKYAFSITSYGNIFDAFNQTIGLVVNLFGASSISMIFLYTLCALFWFFGIHPSPIISLYTPFIIAPLTQNFEAFLSGKPLPHLELIVVFTAMSMGATGSTLGLAISTFFAKSEKYKAMKKLVVIPNLFNINEPIIFGFPVMLNPIYFIPMILAPLASGFSAILLTKLIQPEINPSIDFPWITPQVISSVFQGGLRYFIIILILIGIQTFIYFPFFKIDDNRELAEEGEGKLNEV